METESNQKNKRVLTITAITVAIFAVVMIAVKAYEMMNREPRTQDTTYQEPATTTPDVVSKRASMTGTYVDCLPLHDNFSEKICTPGFKTDDNKYYALDFALMSQEKTELKAGDRFSANGLLTPIEMLSSDRWQGVAAAGIFSVTDSVKKETK